MTTNSAGAQGADQRDTDPDRRRVNRRTSGLASIRVVCCEGRIRRRIDMLLRDVSPRGMGVVHSEYLPVGTHFIIHPADGVSKDLLYEIVHSRKVDNVYQSGCAFVCVLSGKGEHEDGPQRTAEELRRSILSS